jgi:hypothetical protein
VAVIAVRVAAPLSSESTSEEEGKSEGLHCS